MWIALANGIKILAVLAAVAGAIYTAVQFERSKRWRAADLARTLLSMLDLDDELSLACHMIDWGTGPLIVPARYRALLELRPEDPSRPTARERGEVIFMDLNLMARALKPTLAFDPTLHPEGLVYRYCFDKLFSHLAHVYNLLNSGQLYLSHLDGFVYWLTRIETYEYAPGGNGSETFQPFLKYKPFGYQSVVELGKCLGVSGWE